MLIKKKNGPFNHNETFERDKTIYYIMNLLIIKFFFWSNKTYPIVRRTSFVDSERTDGSYGFLRLIFENLPITST